MSAFMRPPGREYDFGSFAAKPTVYIVCYDLKAFFWNYNKLFDELKRSISWWHYLDRTWIIIRNESLEELSNMLLPLIYQNVNDSLLIMPAKGPAAGMLPQEAWDWIRQYVPNY